MSTAKHVVLNRKGAKTQRKTLAPYTTREMNDEYTTECNYPDPMEK